VKNELKSMCTSLEKLIPFASWVKIPKITSIAKKNPKNLRQDPNNREQ
jgi:hypothetical protein